MKGRKKKQSVPDGKADGRKAKTDEASSDAYVDLKALTIEEKRERAYEMYLINRGSLTFQEIANRFGVPRQTISGWANRGKWRERVDEVRRATDEKITETIVDKQVGRYMEEFEKDLAFYKALDDILSSKLFKMNPDGTPATDAAGRYILNRTLSTKELRDLEAARSNAIRTKLLIKGKPTDNSSVTVNGEIKHDNSEQVKRARENVTEFLKAGGSDAQAVIMTLLNHIKPDEK